jgi:hypothetical protein
MRVARVLVASASAVALAGTLAWAGTADDDLSIVKKATAVQKQDEPPAKLAPSEPPPARTKGEKPRWLKVRIAEKGQKKARVSINLPLDVVRALPDDVPMDWNGRRHDRDGHRLRLSEILKALDTGQNLVEIEDEDATVKVWIE